MTAKKALSAIAQSCMSFPVRSVLPAASIKTVQEILLRSGHGGLCVVDHRNALVGIVSRRDVDVAIRYGLAHRAVLTCMNAPVKTITPDTSLRQIQSLMASYDIGRLPVVAAGALVGIVTRGDLLRQLQQVAIDTDRLPSAEKATSQTLAASGSLIPSMLASSDKLYEQLQHRITEISPDIWSAMTLIANIADAESWTIYLVGGGVRDLLLSQLPSQLLRQLSASDTGKTLSKTLDSSAYPLTDIDLVVAGADAGAGVSLAKAIQASYPQVKTQIYGQFQTAALTWSATTSSPPFSIDIATARTEFYPYPAANPEVASSTIHQDLYRRDFTINAMALRLNGTNPGQLLDAFGGWHDLQQGLLRVIHPNSFIEDPTRIFRAVRFAVRLDFSLASHTQQLVRYAIASGLYSQLHTQLQSSGQKIPALQSRLTAELRSLLSLDLWASALAQIDALGALACVHLDLSLSAQLWQQLRRMARWQPKFLPSEPRWQLLLMLMIAQLAPVERDRVAIRLHLDSQSQHRLKQLHTWEADLTERLPRCQKPSQVYDQLRPYSRVELLLIADRHPHTLGPQIWHYITHLSQMLALINGVTLKRLGYQPGPQFRDILTTVHQLTLDRELDHPEAAENYVLAHYPLDTSL